MKKQSARSKKKKGINMLFWQKFNIEANKNNGYFESGFKIPSLFIILNHSHTMPSETE